MKVVVFKDPTGRDTFVGADAVTIREETIFVERDDQTTDYRMKDVIRINIDFSNGSSSAIDVFG